MWTFQDHGSTHEAEFGRERPPGYRWLPHIQPSPVAAARSIWKTCFKDAGLAPAEPLPVARDLGDTSLMFLVHPTITPKQMARLAVDCSPRPARPRWRSESGSDRGARWRIGASGAGRALPAAGSAGATPAGPAFGAGAAADSLSPHTSATALNHWAALAAVARGLRHRDPDHGTLRLVAAPPRSSSPAPLARIALAGRGIQIQPDPPPPPGPSEHRKLLRDALRLALWRSTGSTGAWLVPQIVARKRADFGV